MSIGMGRTYRNTSAYGRCKRARPNLYTGAICLISGLILIVAALVKGNI